LPLVGAALELAFARLRTYVGRSFAAGAVRVTALVAYVLAGLVVLSLLGSLVVSYPQLPLEPVTAMTAAERTSAVLRTMATMFRLAEPNFLLASSFWLGFGWLDTMPGAHVQGLLVGLAGVASAALLLDVGRHGRVRRLLWLLAFGAGAVASLVLYTLSTQGIVAALQGRYLIGWYLPLLAVISSALVLEHRGSARGPAPTVGRTRAAMLLAVASAVHAYCLSFVLQRYF
jgi:hypothetical protein